VKSGEITKDKGEDGAGKDIKAGGSPEGGGLSAPSGENFSPLDASEGQGTGTRLKLKGRIKSEARAESGSKATARRRSGGCSVKIC
jgi:hypothetical protein